MVFNVEFCFGPHKYALKLILCIKVAFDYVFDFFFQRSKTDQWANVDSQNAERSPLDPSQGGEPKYL